MVKVGLVGTGFVARLRADALVTDGRGQVVAVAGHQWLTTQTFAQSYGATPVATWEELVNHPEVELVMVCHINRDHGVVTQAALAAGKHVVVEYPLALALSEAEEILALARAKQRLLHVEHIELLGGTHQTLKAHLPTVGSPIYGRYCTLSAKRSAPEDWSYSPDLFGFPLIGALSRIHRLVDCFGPVARVYGQNHYEGMRLGEDGLEQYTTCLCSAQLTFTSGLMAEVVYGKGESIWSNERRFEVWGRAGQIILEGEQGRLISAAGSQTLEIGSRRGLFAIDTQRVLDHLERGTPLYCTPEASLYSLKVATAVQTSAMIGQAVGLTDNILTGVAAAVPGSRAN